jgi:endonuclease/exonuclease/phosphatase family metal-dependent hydrolase/predicted phosphodiesterase
MSENTFSRRDFLATGLAAGFGCASGCVSFGDGGAVKFGVISDTHVTGKESVGELSRTFAFLRDKGVDAVIHCGDMTDFGYLHQLEAFAEAWNRVMPPEMPLIPVLGNRDMTDTNKIPQERREADRNRLVLSDPAGHLRRILGVEIGNGIRAVQVRGVNVVAADWKHEGELEMFMRNRADLLDPSRPLIQVQHPHPNGIFSRELNQNPVTCWLNMFPKAISVSGHSHLPFSDPFTFCAGEFTFVAAGSHYLSGGLPQKGLREVSVLTVSGERMDIDRYRLHDGSSDSLGRAFEEKRRPSRPAAADSFVFATWNIGAFTHGCGGRAQASRACHADALRRQLAGMDADVVGVGEYRPQFLMGGTSAAEVFGAYRHSAVGPLTGGNCNAVFSRRFPVSGMRCSDFAERRQQRYFLACDIEIGGQKAVLVQTHLDLVEECRQHQLARLANEFKDCERVIVAGDFNIARLDEYRVFTDAGFKMANASSFGRFRTHRKRYTTFSTAIDNVMVKGFDILDAWTEDDSMLLSDHRILLCRLRIKGGDLL